jgi:phosphinothricin acetyltransferase
LSALKIFSFAMITVKPMEPVHTEEVLEIYREGINTGIATFETIVPSWSQFDKKHLNHSRLVLAEDGAICGWAALSPVSIRKCYSGVAEVSVYVGTNKRGRGFGKKLLEELIRHSEENGIWSLLSVIDRENNASIQLHEACGFREIGFREKIAQVNGVWRTTVMFERRSKTIGL